ncbi:MAG: sugar phosphate isomerase/epimerase [Firmicutes bacterium]|jgi:sugar phosphate isomerase/epimerase|nr:sugar phosphate isomerase/epimerase [Bacillota bacterium]
MSHLKLACCLIQWAGETRRDLEKALREVANAGWDGVESYVVDSAEESVCVATLARRYNLHWVDVICRDPIQMVKYNIALGNAAVEVPMRARRDYGEDNPTDADYERAARTLDEVLAFCRTHHIKGYHHAHLGTMIETVRDAERLLAAAADLYLLLDTGHLLAAGCDLLQVFRSDTLRHRIAHVHLKDFHADDPRTQNHRPCKWGEQGRFAELGNGDFAPDVKGVLEALGEVGYDGWVSVELDRPYPVRPPADAARANREYLRSLGY